MEVEMSKNNLGKFWHKKGDWLYWHREDGPAIIFNDGEETWYYHNKFYEYPEKMPLNLYLAYCKWEYRKIHGS